MCCDANIKRKRATHTVSPDVRFGRESGVVQHFGRGPFDGEFGSAATCVLVVKHVPTLCKQRNVNGEIHHIKKKSA